MISIDIDLNFSYVQRTGFVNPIVVKQHRGLGLRVPTAKFTVRDVRSCVGSKRLIDVMNVDTQTSLQMTMKSWTDYYEQSANERTRLLNVISLEFSHTALETYVESPLIV
jgi:F-box and leucine-rich repeat protein 10/11